MGLLPCQRAAFDIPSEVAYLNCAYQSPLSRAVVAAGRMAIQHKAQPWGTVAEDFFAPCEVARDLFARVVGADAEGDSRSVAAKYAGLSKLPFARLRQPQMTSFPSGDRCAGPRPPAALLRTLDDAFRDI